MARPLRLRIPDDLRGRALEALTDPAVAALSVDLVIGANSSNRERVAAVAEARGNARLPPPRPHLADLMAKANLAIGAGGAAIWKRCCLGSPSLVVSIADNQRPACGSLAATSLIAYLGHTDEVTIDRLRRTLQTFVVSPDPRRRLSAAGADPVDGRGVERVVRRLFDEERLL